MVIIHSPSCTPWARRITMERTLGGLELVGSRLRSIYAGIVRSNCLHNLTLSATTVPALPSSFEPSVALTRYFTFYSIFTSIPTLFPYRGRILSLVPKRQACEPWLCTARTSIVLFLDNSVVPPSHLSTGTRPVNCVRPLANPHGWGTSYQGERPEANRPGETKQRGRFPPSLTLYINRNAVNDRAYPSGLGLKIHPQGAPSLNTRFAGSHVGEDQ